MNRRTALNAASSFMLIGAVTLSGCASKDTGMYGDLEDRIYDLEDRVIELEMQEPETTVIREGVDRGPSRLSDVPAGYVSAHMAVPTGSQYSSALLVEKMVPETVIAGSEFESYIKLTNLTENLNLVNLSLRDEFSAGYRMNSASPAPASSNAMGATWEMDSLMPGDSVTITLNGVAQEEGPIELCAFVDYDPQLCIGTLAERPALELTKTGPSEVLLCDEIVYEITVTNTGTGPANNVEVMDDLPSGVTTVDGQSSMSWSVGTLAAGQSESFTIRAEASRTGTFDNTAMARGDAGLSAESQTVTTFVGQPVLEVDVTCSEREFAGREIYYDGTVTNTGNAVSDDTVVTMTVPDCTVFNSASGNGQLAGNQVVWNLGALEPGATRNVRLTVQADNICDATSTIRAEGVCAEADTDECTTRLVGIPAVLLEVIDVKDPVRIGDTTTYVITVTNQGTADDTGIAIVAELENFTHVSNSGVTNGNVSANGRVITFDPLPLLAPGAEAEWRIEARADEIGDVRFAVRMDTDRLTRPVEETEATNIYTFGNEGPTTTY